MFGKDFLKKLQEAQSAISEMQTNLENIKVEFSSGGGMITATMNGKKDLLDISINPQVVNPDDVEMLQDLIIAAVNGASTSVEDKIKEEMGDLQAMFGQQLA